MRVVEHYLDGLENAPVSELLPPAMLTDFGFVVHRITLPSPTILSAVAPSKVMRLPFPST
jgi:hypothetical protein